MTRIALILAFLLAPLCAAFPAAAQVTSKAVTSCGASSFSAGTAQYAQMNLTGRACVEVPTGGTSQPIAGSTGGAAPVSKIVANNTTSVAICTAACNLYAVRLTNNSATIAYLKLYNATQGSTTCGSGTPVDRILIPASTSGAGIVVQIGGAVGDSYSTALTACTTTGIADNDTGAPGATTYLETFDVKQ